MATLDIHYQAEDFREKEQFVEALKLYEESIVAYQKEKNYSGINECFNGKSLTYKHLFWLTGDKIFAFLARKSAETSLEIIFEFKLDTLLYACYLSLAEAESLFDDKSTKAFEYFKKAFNLYPREDAQKGRYQYHFGEALYKSGDKIDGLKNMVVGLELIREFKSQNTQFLNDVWETGCLLKMAELLVSDSPEESKKYLQEAAVIISANPLLVIRKRQLAELSQKLT